MPTIRSTFIHRVVPLLLSAICVLLGFVISQQIAWGCSACLAPGSDVYVRMHLEVDNDHLQNLHFRWDFAESLSHDLLSEYDENGDGILNPAEERDVAAFFDQNVHLQEYEHIALNARELTSPDFKNMQFEWAEDQGRLSFTLPLHEPIDEQLQLSIRFIDPDGEFQFYYVQDSVTWNSPLGYRLTDNAHLFPQTLEVRVESQGNGQE
ncbi:MAG: DUF1007 family protein [Desulfovermiculus sp.]